MQAGVGLLDIDVMPMFMIIALDVIIIMLFSINCSAVICSATVIYAISGEATSETYGPQVCFLYLLFSFVYLYQISLLQVTMKGLTTPLSRWLQVLDCLCRYSLTCASSPTGLIPWFSN